MPEFECTVCNELFTLPDAVLEKYPNWKPKYCKKHSPNKAAVSQAKPSTSSGVAKTAKKAKKYSSQEKDLSLAQVLEKYSEGPQSGIFTDGSARPNPGPGGWGLVWVKDGKVLKQLYGAEANTTNNRMELTALINAYQILDENLSETIYTDSELCVNILTKWAKNWKAKGWKKKDGAIKNLELVQELYELYLKHPNVSLSWIKAHNGWLWNEYADSLATFWARDDL